MQLNSPDGTTVSVSGLNRLLVEAAIRGMGGVISEDGYAFSWSSTIHDILVNETVLLIKNTYDGHFLVVDKIIPVGIKQIFKVHTPTVVTFSGTSVVGVCLNTDYNLDDNADAYQHETANTEGSIVMLGDGPIDLNGELRIGAGKAVAIDYTDEAANSGITLIGHFE